MKTIAALLMA